MRIWLSLSIAKSIGERSMSVMEIACPLWPRATGVEPELTLLLSITARGALQKLLSYTILQCLASWAYLVDQYHPAEHWTSSWLSLRCIAFWNISLLGMWYFAMQRKRKQETARYNSNCHDRNVMAVAVIPFLFYRIYVKGLSNHYCKKFFQISIKLSYTGWFVWRSKTIQCG